MSLVGRRTVHVLLGLLWIYAGKKHDYLGIFYLFPDPVTIIWRFFPLCYNLVGSVPDLCWEGPKHFYGESPQRSYGESPRRYYGDARLRRERLAPECEPRGAELEKSAQKIKCQPHFLRRYAPRCLISSRE